jgi:hypothetical protein
MVGSSRIASGSFSFSYRDGFSRIPGGRRSLPPRIVIAYRLFSSETSVAALGDPRHSVALAIAVQYWRRIFTGKSLCSPLDGRVRGDISGLSGESWKNVPVKSGFSFFVKSR